MLFYRLLDSRGLRLPFVLLILVSFSSCSWFSSGSPYGDASNETVPKEEFDRLLTKYEALKKSQALDNATQNVSGEGMGDLNAIEKDSEDIVRKLKRIPTNPQRTTRSVPSEPLASKPMSMDTTPRQVRQPIEIKAQVKSTEYPTQMVEAQIKKVRQAESYVVQNKFAEGLKLIKELEVSPVKQIAVRAKFLLGETFFRQGEYDLAMQVYEEILRKFSFSGLVIKSLGRLIVCSEKLNIPQKKEKYYSILYDFFEQG